MKCIPTYILLLGLTLVAKAETPRFGINAGLRFGSAASRDINSKAGYSAGLFLDFALGGHQTLRPRFDYAFHPKQSDQFPVPSNWDLQSYRTQTSWKVTSFGLDYLYHVQDAGHGLFLVGGLTYSRMTSKQDQDSTFISYPPLHTTADYTAPYKVGCALGVGYTFTQKWSTQLRFTSRKGSGDFAATSLDAYNYSVYYRF